MPQEHATQTDTTRRLVRAAAFIDLAVTWPLLLPVTAKAFLALVYAANHGLFNGGGQRPDLPALGWLFVNLAGVLAVLWALVRLLEPAPLLGAADALARLWVATLVAFYVLGAGLPPALLVFVATELLGTGLQIPALRAAWRQRQAAA